MSERKGMLALLSLVCVALLCTGVVSCAKKAAVPEQEVTQPAYEAPKPAPMPEAAEPAVKGPSALEEAQSALKDAYFDFDKYNIRPDAREALKANYQVLSGLGEKVQILVEGHCDERGTVEYNLALGQRRADAAKAYYVSLGMSADSISTISYGKERPVDPGHNEEAWAKNRRAHTVIQGM
jgi:peptidoglycan-associated lipoprotein